MDRLEKIDGVKGVYESSGQLQIIIGPGSVTTVYDAFLAISGMSGETHTSLKRPIWLSAIKTLGDVFVPILPAIVASGLLMGVLEALGKVIPGFSASGWYGFLDLISSTAFAYLPVLVAISATSVFGGNILLGSVIGLTMVNSSLLNAWSAGSANAVNAFFGVADGMIPGWKLLIFNVKRVGYQGHVIPVIIAVWIMCLLEKWLHKHVPEMIDLFVTPLTTVFCTLFVTFTLIGPLFSKLEAWVLTGAEWLVQNPIGASAMGAVYPLTVVMGLHHMYNIIEAGMLASAEGLNTWMPIATAANFAQFGACLAVAVKTKSSRNRQVAFPSAMSASLGITEPAIFGINLRFMKPFAAGMIAGAIGALFASLSGLGASTYGVTGILGYLTINNYFTYTLLLAISGGIAFFLTSAMWHEEEVEEREKEESVLSASSAGSENQDSSRDSSQDSSQDDRQDAYKEIFRCGAGRAYAPTKGRIIPGSEIPDETFSSGVLGQGVGILPEEDVVYAPYDGSISSIAETMHAIGISGSGDMEILVHVGIDTVKMNGDGFTVYVSEDEEVKKGQKLMTFDRSKIKAAGCSDCVVVLLTNSEDYDDFTLS